MILQKLCFAVLLTASINPFTGYMMQALGASTTNSVATTTFNEPDTLMTTDLMDGSEPPLTSADTESNSTTQEPSPTSTPPPTEATTTTHPSDTSTVLETFITMESPETIAPLITYTVVEESTSEINISNVSTTGSPNDSSPTIGETSTATAVPQMNTTINESITVEGTTPQTTSEATINVYTTTSVASSSSPSNATTIINPMTEDPMVTNMSTVLSSTTRASSSTQSANETTNQAQTTPDDTQTTPDDTTDDNGETVSTADGRENSSPVTLQTTSPYAGQTPTTQTTAATPLDPGNQKTSSTLGGSSPTESTPPSTTSENNPVITTSTSNSSSPTTKPTPQELTWQERATMFFMDYWYAVLAGGLAIILLVAAIVLVRKKCGREPYSNMEIGQYDCGDLMDTVVHSPRRPKNSRGNALGNGLMSMYNPGADDSDPTPLQTFKTNNNSKDGNVFFGKSSDQIQPVAEEVAQTEDNKSARDGDGSPDTQEEDEESTPTRAHKAAMQEREQGACTPTMADTTANQEQDQWETTPPPPPPPPLTLEGEQEPHTFPTHPADSPQLTGGMEVDSVHTKQTVL